MQSTHYQEQPQLENQVGLFVRGGEGYETKVFIDGLEVRGAFAATVPNVPTAEDLVHSYSKVQALAQVDIQQNMAKLFHLP